MQKREWTREGGRVTEMKELDKFKRRIHEGPLPCLQVMISALIVTDKVSVSISVVCPLGPHLF